MEALALSGQPLTPYRIAKEYNMNIAKTYMETKSLARLGVVRAVRKSRGLEYELADEEVRRVALRYRSRVIPFSRWASGERARFTMGMEKVPDFGLGAGGGPDERPSRLPGELDALASLGRKRFDAKYRRTEGREFAGV